MSSIAVRCYFLTLVFLVCALTVDSADLNHYSYRENGIMCNDLCECYVSGIDHALYIIEFYYKEWGTTYGKCYIEVYRLGPKKIILHTCAVEEGQRCGRIREIGCHCLEYNPPYCKFMLNLTAEKMLEENSFEILAHTYGAPVYNERKRQFGVRPILERERLFFKINGLDILRPNGCHHYATVGDQCIFEFCTKNLCPEKNRSLSMRIGSALYKNCGPCISQGLIIPENNFNVELFYKENIRRVGLIVCKIYTNNDCFEYGYESANMTVDGGEDLFLLPECHLSLEVGRAYATRFCTTNLNFPTLTVKVNDTIVKTSNSSCVRLLREVSIGQNIYEFSHVDKCKTPKSYICSFYGITTITAGTTECTDCEKMTTAICLDCGEGSSKTLVFMTVTVAGVVVFLGVLYYSIRKKADDRHEEFSGGERSKRKIYQESHISLRTDNNDGTSELHPNIPTL